MKGVKSPGLCITNTGTTFSRVPCVARLEVAKRGTCTIFRRQKWISYHCFWKFIVLKYCDHQLWRYLEGLSSSSLSSVQLPNAGLAVQQWPQANHQMFGCEPTQVVATQKQWLPIDASMSSSFVILLQQLEILVSWISPQAPSYQPMPSRQAD